MGHPNPSRPLHLGMRPGELDGKPYRHHFNPRLGGLPAHAQQALLHGPVAAPLLPLLSSAPELLQPGYGELEDGFGFADDGSLHIAIRTDLPDVTPAMIDWWFGWHGEEPQRYKLWHPRAHVCAQWSTPDSPEQRRAQGRVRYVGRTSYVDEYIGSKLNHVTIRFLPPAELGFNEAALADPGQATMVCARIGFAEYPVEAGYLVHHVRRVAGGSEMRSRFWLGGPYSLVHAGPAGRLVTEVVRRMVSPSLEEGRDLLVHCSQEMSHLGTFLPALYQELRDLP